MGRRAGFSLMELMTVVTILGLLALFSIPAVNKYLTDWNLKNSRNMVISEIKLLRQRAITQGRSLRIWFSQGSNQYWFQDPTTLTWTMYKLPNRVNFSYVLFPGGPYDTYLEPDGRSRRSGTIFLQSSAGQQDTVLVDLTGWVGRP
jgi:prepilin-type N-terminal cleavage/methylation domain-containing protein